MTRTAEAIEPQLLSPVEAAELAGTEVETIFKMMSDDQLDYVELRGGGGEYVIPLTFLKGSLDRARNKQVL